MNTYRIFTVWTGAYGYEDTGMLVKAENPERAVELAVMRGVCSGLGRLPSYQGIAAFPEPEAKRE